MAPSTSDESTGTLPASPPDRLGRAVQVVMAIYLTPLLLVVCAIGGASILLDRTARAAGRIASRSPGTRAPGDRSAARSASAIVKPLRVRGPRRIRV